MTPRSIQVLFAKLRKHVLAVRPQRQRLDPANRRERKRPIKMRKQLAAARGLMAQCGPKHGGVHRQQQQVLLAGKMARRRLGDLRGSGEMDEAVRMVDRRADEDASPFSVAPKGAGADL